MLETFLSVALAAPWPASAANAAAPQDPPPATAPAAQAAAAAPDENARLARLVQLAALLQDPQQDPVPLATEAVRLAGFVLWDEDRQVLAEPLGAPRLGLAITDAEIRAYTTMLREGQSVQRGDLIAAVDVLYQGLGAKGSVAPFVLAWLRDGTNTSNPSARALAVLLQALGNQRSGAEGRLDGAADVALDPLQALLMLRVLTEDLGTPLRRAIGRGEIGEAGKDGKEEPPRGPAAAPTPILDEPPGWAEDAYAGGITGLWGEVVGGLGEWGKGISNGVGKANALMSICKFIATYTFLRGEVRVEEPGQPLVRTKNSDPGEQRTLVARFWIDGTRVTDWMKEHRQIVVLAGLDLDMPKTGALKGIETEWDIEQDRHSSKYHLIQTVRGQPDISKVRTDGNGEARIQVEGCPQPKVLDPKKVMPLAKQVAMVVTPQIKTTEMQQDLVDAVTGAIGLKDGPIGLITPIIETLYRLEWKGGVRFVLQVRDWQPAESIGQLEITLRANGHRFTRTSSHQLSLARSLKFTDAKMNVAGVEPPPPPDPEVLKRMPPLYREQMEAGYRQMAELAKQRSFLSDQPGQVEFHQHDRELSVGEGDGCSDGTEEERTSWDGDAAIELGGEEAMLRGARFSIECDLEKRTAKLTQSLIAEATVVRTSSSRHRKAET
ncbi:MAG: hypothetical protein FJ265_17900, partial [Planctomycetes bacterium]|nr:hypothetical protein [Planctomycetota bacterium]